MYDWVSWIFSTFVLRSHKLPMQQLLLHREDQFFMRMGGEGGHTDCGSASCCVWYTGSSIFDDHFGALNNYDFKVTEIYQVHSLFVGFSTSRGQGGWFPPPSKQHSSPSFFEEIIGSDRVDISGALKVDRLAALVKRYELGGRQNVVLVDDDRENVEDAVVAGFDGVLATRPTELGGLVGRSAEVR